MLSSKRAVQIRGVLVSHQEQLSRGLLGLSVFLFVLYFSLYQIRAHHALWTGVDLASVEQMLWTTLHGHFMRLTIYPPTGEYIADFSNRLTESWLGTHVQPFFLLLVLPYALFQSPEILMVLLSLAVGLGALPVYSLTHRRFSSPWVALAGAGLYLLLPAVQTNVAWEVHSASFLPPLLLAGLDAAERGKRTWWWIWILLAMGCREDIPFLVGWAMLWLAPHAQRRTAKIMFGVGLLWSLLSFFVIIPRFGGGSPYLAFFFPPGTPMNMTSILRALRDSQYWLVQMGHFLEYNIFLGLPLLFMYYLHIPSLLAMAPLLLLNGLGWHQAVRLPFFSHYSAPIVPWTVVGTIEGVRSLVQGLRRRRPLLKAQGLLWVSLLLTVILVNIMQGYLPFSLPTAWPQPLRSLSVVKSGLEALPEDASLSAGLHLASHLAQRTTIRLFPDMRGSDWLALDVWNWADPYGPAVSVWEGILDNPGWETFVAQDGVLVLHRGEGPPQHVGSAFVSEDASLLKHVEVRFGDAWRLTGVDVVPLPLGHFFLCTEWESEASAEVRPAIRLNVDTEPQSLSSYTLLPELYARPGAFRDCTQLLAPMWGANLTVWLTLEVVRGDVLVPVIEDAGEWDERVWQENQALRLEIPAW